MRGLPFFLAFLFLTLLALRPDFGTDPRRMAAPLDLPWNETERSAETSFAERLRLPDALLPRRGTVWSGETACGPEIFDLPARLPGLTSVVDGPDVATPVKLPSGTDFLGAATRLYSRDGQSTLRVVEPQLRYYAVYGRSFRAARQDLMTRRPLNRELPEDAQVASDNRVTVGHIVSPSRLSYRLSRFGPNWRDGDFRLVADETELLSAHEITLPRWTGYAKASRADRKKWDEMICSTAHHELGHLRIRLDRLAESLPGYAELSAPTRDGLTLQVRDYRNAVEAAISARQALYHRYNGGGTRRGMIERPYAELPFPWLTEADRDDASE